MLTSLTGKMNICPEKYSFSPVKRVFLHGQPVFSVYLGCMYLCTSLFMSKIRIFVCIFSFASTNGWKYAILRMRKVQSVKNEQRQFRGADIPAIRNIILPWITMELLTEIGIVKIEDCK